MMRKYRWLIVLHVVAVAYVLPAINYAGQPLQRHSAVSTYRMSAMYVVGVLICGWNFAYWVKGFFPMIYRLSPRVQARTGARVHIATRGIEWDRPVGWMAALGLQLRFLGLIVVGFGLWGVLMIPAIVIMIFLNQGSVGVASFFR
jgi:hypothetical protein